MAAGDIISLAALTTNAYANTALSLTTFTTVGTSGTIVGVVGNYNASTGIFTTNTSGADTAIQWDSDGTADGAADALETIILVGFANTASTTTTDGVITLA